MRISTRDFGAMVAVVVAGIGCSARHCDPPDRMIGEYCAVPCAAVSGYCDPADGAPLSVDGGADGATDATGPADAACPTGESRCGEACVATQASAENCGACGRVCPGVAGATATCSAGVCGFACVAGFDAVGAACDVAVPRPIAPQSTAHVTVQQPTFRWVAPVGVDGGVVEVCRDRACTTVMQRVTATGTHARASSALTAGVWFWRVRGTSHGMTSARTSAVWQFTVGAASAPHESSWGSVLDVNGDGFGDVAVGEPDAMDGVGKVEVFLGNGHGVTTTPMSLTGPTVPFTDYGRSVSSAGDVNGDGFADLVVGNQRDSDETGEVRVYLGGNAGLTTTIVLRGMRANESFGTSVAGVGDVDGDGYGDLVVGAGRPTYFLVDPRTGVHELPGAAPAFYFFRGHEAGPGPVYDATWSAAAPSEVFAPAQITGADFDGDGYSDFVVAIGNLGGGFAPQFVAGSATGPHRIGPLIPDALQSDTPHVLPTTIGDCNGDGLADLAFADWENSVLIYIGVGGQQVPAPYFVLSTSAAVSSLAGGDLDGDGLSDVFAGQADWQSNSGLVEAFVAAPGAFALSRVIDVPVTDGPVMEIGAALGTGDVDGDGLDDLLVGAPRARAGQGDLFLVSGSRSTIGVATLLLRGADGELLGYAIAR